MPNFVHVSPVWYTCKFTNSIFRCLQTIDKSSSAQVAPEQWVAQKSKPIFHALRSAIAARARAKGAAKIRNSVDRVRRWLSKKHPRVSFTAEFDSHQPWTSTRHREVTFCVTLIQYSSGGALKNWVTSQRPNSLSAFPIDFWRAAKSAPVGRHINNKMVPPGPRRLKRARWKISPSKIGYFATAAGNDG